MVASVYDRCCALFRHATRISGRSGKRSSCSWTSAYRRGPRDLVFVPGSRGRERNMHHILAPFARRFLKKSVKSPSAQKHPPQKHAPQQHSAQKHSAQKHSSQKNSAKMIDVDSVTTLMAASNIASSDYTKNTRALINLITELRALGSVSSL